MESNMEEELFRVVLGPSCSLQSPFVQDTIKEMVAGRKFGNRKIKFEYTTIQEVVIQKLTASEFLKWCEDAKYLIFCGHPLQNDFGPLWDHIKFAEDLREVARAKGRKVFPPAEAMHAAFTQDKREIYETLKEFMLPTFIIERPNGPDVDVTSFDETTLAELYDFCTHNYEIHSNHTGGWYCKLTATTGGKGTDSSNTLSGVPLKVKSLMNREYMMHKPTVAVQATMATTRELKYFILSNPHTGEETMPAMAYNFKAGKGRSFRENPKIVEFVKRAKREYEKVYGPHSTSPVFRCDMFLCQDGRIVINEIEHFEAQIDCNDAILDGVWRRFIPNFWEHQILYMVNDEN